MEKILFSKIQVWVVAISAIIIIPLFTLWGFSISYFHVFPYKIIKDIQDFVEGDPADKRSFWTRLKMEFKFNPAAFEVPITPLPSKNIKLRPVLLTSYAHGIKPITKSMKYYSSEKEVRYFLIYGSFVFEDIPNHWGAILIDNSGNIHRGWSMKPTRYKTLGGNIGFDIASNGDVISNAHGVLQSYNWCGQKNWEAEWQLPESGIYLNHNDPRSTDWHHDIVVINDLVYTFRGGDIVTVNAKDGEILSDISVIDLMRWARKDDLSFFETRADHYVEDSRLDVESVVNSFHKDPFHFNKIDILTDELAPLYPKFDAGDMLLSARNLNLILVVRPNYEKIVWWSHGLTHWQHDSTFIDGYIEVFDNRPHTVPPEPQIVRLATTDRKREVVFDLSRWNFEMRIKGNFVRDGEKLLVPDDDAGRVIAGRLDGSIDFLFENSYLKSDGELVNLQVRNALEVTAEQVEAFEATCQ